MNDSRRAALLFLALAAIAAAFRFPQLAARPMHADEAVNADKLGTLLEHGRYEYSSVEFHGPTLYYAALVVARAHGLTDYRELNEAVLRVVPAILGVLLVAAHFWLIPYLGLPAAACAALFTAVSPVMVYYSRYFIHETLLLFLTFCALLAVLAYLERPRAGLALTIGAVFGLMYATKETWIIAAACMLAAGLDKLKHASQWGAAGEQQSAFSGQLPAAGLGKLKHAPPKRLSGNNRSLWSRLGMGCVRFRAATKGSGYFRTNPKHLLLAAVGFVVMAGVFLSSFFTHPRGIVDSVLAYGTYFARGVGVHTVHVHPWYFYFACLRGEVLIGALACVGLALSNAPRFLKIYTVLMVAMYCAIPYKAPWNVLSFWHAGILLAAAGVVWLFQRLSKPLVVVTMAMVVASLAGLARGDSMEYASDPRNPWVYAHTGTDVFQIIDVVKALAAVHPDGRAMPIQIFTHNNLWPLPWYLRRYPNVRWWNGVSDSAPLAPVILATPEMKPALLHRIYEVPPPGHREMYVNMFDRYVELRPRVEVRGYVAKSLWDDMR